MGIRFTKHATLKFGVMRRHGVRISKDKVMETVLHPEHTDQSRLPIVIAQATLDRNRVLRVVYRRRKHAAVIITFYPGKKSQYEKG